MGLWHAAVLAASLLCSRHRISCENLDSAELVSSIDTATATAGSVRGARKSLPSARRWPLAVIVPVHAQSMPKLLQLARAMPSARHFEHDVSRRWQFAEQVQSRPAVSDEGISETFEPSKTRV